MIDNVKALYEPHVLRARDRIHSDPGIRTLIDPSIDPVLLLRFLITYSAAGVQMTEPVEGWIKRAGERCVAVGLNDIGRSLIMHARHEAGHHLMMIHDARHLVPRWNSKHSSELDADHLIAAPPLRSTRDYVKMHEDTIESDMPFGQVAIEYEIESLSTTIISDFVDNCKRVLGPEISGGLSFLEEHVEIDVGHTQLNEKIMGRLLAARPGSAEALGRAGSLALDTYSAFLNECLTIADAALKSEGGVAALGRVAGVASPPARRRSHVTLDVDHIVR